MAVHRLAPDEARRIAIGAQMLDASRPATLLEVVERLTFLQIDPTAAIAPSADLVAWSRLGAACDPEDVRRARERDRTLFELNAKRLWDLAERVYPAGTPVVPVDAEALERPFTGRTALLSPFDRLVHDRARTTELFGFEYVLEMYKPKAKRRWGYFALPILHHDRLVGKLDATADRKAGVLRVDAIHEDGRFTRAIRAAVDDEIAALAAWLGLAVRRAQ